MTAIAVALGAFLIVWEISPISSELRKIREELKELVELQRKAGK